MDIRWVIAISLLIVIAQSLIFRLLGLRRLSYERHFNERAVYCGQQVELVEHLANDKWLPLPWVTIESMFPTGLSFQGIAETDVVTGEAFQYHQSLFTLSSYTRVIRRHQITCLARGVYGVQEATLTCGDLFGAKPRFVQVQAESELTVYPAILPLSEIPLPTHSWQGSIAVRRFIMPDPFTYSGTREYQYGDSQNQIHWSATARTSRLQVHKRDFTADYRLMILLNFEVTSDMWEIVTDPARIELGLSYAATIVQEAITQGIEVGFACNGLLPDAANHTASLWSGHVDRAPVLKEKRSSPYFAPSSGHEHLHTVLRAMAEVTMRCAGSFHSLLERESLHTGPRLDYLLISAHRSEQMMLAQAALETAGHAIAWLPLDAGDASVQGTQAPLPYTPPQGAKVR